jgi:hypothetical protein
MIDCGPPRAILSVGFREQIPLPPSELRLLPALGLGVGVEPSAHIGDGTTGGLQLGLVEECGAVARLGDGMGAPFGATTKISIMDQPALR